VALVYCYIEGLSRDEAARRLGWSLGTLKRRLERGRAILRRRLLRRGVAPAGLAAAALAPEGLTAAVPPVLAQAVLQAAGRAAGVAPAVARLAEAALRTARPGTAKAVLLALTFLAASAGVWSALAATTDGEAVPPPGAPKAADRAALEKAVTAALEDSFEAYAYPKSRFYDPGEAVRVTAVVSPVPRSEPRALKGHWDRMAAVTGPERRYAVRITVLDDATKKSVWRDDRPIDPGPLADESRRRVPDGKTVYTTFDPQATLAFRVPADRLRPGGAYRVAMTFLAPDGSEHRFPLASEVANAPLFAVRAAPLDVAALVLPGHAVSAPDLLTGAVEIGNPGRRAFPRDTPEDCQARSVWCLQEYQGRVYVGHGDWDKNRGPIKVWSFGPDSAELRGRYPGRYSFAAAGSWGLRFTWEYTVQEESIDLFRVLGGRLAIPGIDGNKEFGPDGIVFGNLYLREKGAWRKLSTLPHARHVMDVAMLGKRLYALADGAWTSEDDGLSWQPAAPEVGSPGGEEWVPFRGGLLALEDGEVALYSADGRATTRRVELFPGYGVGRAHRCVAFGGGVVYTSHHTWGAARDPRHPLMVLRDLAEGPRIFSPFRDRAVRDLLVERETLYVLTARPAEGHFVGEIHATRDLKDWTRLAAFAVPATPNSLARLGGAFYVGLVNRGYDPATYDDHGEHQYAFADRAAGGIYRLTR
jgi:hypothetical protein